MTYEKESVKIPKWINTVFLSFLGSVFILLGGWALRTIWIHDQEITALKTRLADHTATPCDNVPAQSK